MQPSALITVIFVFATMGVLAQEAPTVRPARAVEQPAAVSPAAAPKAEMPANPGKPAARPTEAKPGVGAGAVAPGKPTPGTPVEPVGAGAAMNAAALLPIGVPSYDVRMPEFDEDRLISRMRVRELTRIDDDHLDMRNMDLERYLPTGGLDYVVLVERGFYELSTGRLVSSSPTRLRGKSIDLHGEGCVYSNDADVIKILGKVTSYIYLEKEQIKKPDPDGPAKEANQGDKNLKSGPKTTNP